VTCPRGCKLFAADQQPKAHRTGGAAAWPLAAWLDETAQAFGLDSENKCYSNLASRQLEADPGQPDKRLRPMP